MKKTVALIMAAVMAITLAACSSGSTAPAESKKAVAVDDPRFDTDNEDIKALAGKRIGIANVYVGDEWCRQIADAFATYGKMYGFEVNNQDGELVLEKQVSQIENFITQEYDFLCVDPVDDAGIKPTLNLAKEAGIPVITYDSTSTWEDRVAFVTAGNYDAGKTAGEKAKEYINSELGGKAKIVALTLSQPHTIERLQGFKDALADMPDVEIITEQECGGSLETSANIINSIAEDYDIIFSVVPNGAMGALSAVEALKKENVKIFAAGLYSDDAFQKLQANSPYLMGGCTNEPVSLVTQILELAGKNIATGEVQKDTIYFPLIWVDANNINEIYQKD